MLAACKSQLFEPTFNPSKVSPAQPDDNGIKIPNFETSTNVTSRRQDKTLQDKTRQDHIKTRRNKTGHYTKHFWPLHAAKPDFVWLSRTTAYGKSLMPKANELNQEANVQVEILCNKVITTQPIRCCHR